jgi:hypothetical protein
VGLISSIHSSRSLQGAAAVSVAYFLAYNWCQEIDIFEEGDFYERVKSTGIMTHLILTFIFGGDCLINPFNMYECGKIFSLAPKR